ncbi:MAG: type ISP restriction/modification enzyme, partial [Bacteroidia bacterium]
AILYLIKKEQITKKCRIEYFAVPDNLTRIEKLEFLSYNKFKELSFEKINPDKNNNWISLTENNWDSLLKLCSKENKQSKSESQNTLFNSYSWGNSSNRDAWVYDASKKNLTKKIQFFISAYNKNIKEKRNEYDNSIKWSRDLKRKFQNNTKLKFNTKLIQTAYWRPFTKVKFYAEKVLNDVLTSNHYGMFGSQLDKKNKVLMLINHEQISFGVHAVDKIVDAGYSGRATHNIPFYQYDESENKIDNITNWGLQQFQTNYKSKKITKEQLFNYCYAVLHNPAYRSKYELNLKREFPRIPFYADFDKWEQWGKQLLDLHINYETVVPFKLKEITNKEIVNPKPKLKADKTTGTIVIDEATELTGVPAQAWEYKLGNRSAIEWVLDQYKEHKPTDATILEHFNDYKFADYKTHVIDLLLRVTTVSIETMSITNEMKIIAE